MTTPSLEPADITRLELAAEDYADSTRCDDDMLAWVADVERGSPDVPTEAHDALDTLRRLYYESAAFADHIMTQIDQGEH